MPVRRYDSPERLRKRSGRDYGLDGDEAIEMAYENVLEFMSHRIREAFIKKNAEPLGGKGKVVEADETYYGNVKGAVKGRGGAHKHQIVALVERGGEVRSFHVHKITAKDVHPIIRANVRKESRLHTDEFNLYKKLGKEFASHESVNHGDYEYARGDVTTNNIEGFFSIMKRGLTGIYQHVGGQHLQRYCTEFDFRYSNRIALGIDDQARTNKALKGITGKRLTYRRTSQQQGQKLEA